MWILGFSASLASISAGAVIHLVMSSPDSLPPTPSSGYFLFPLPSIAWHCWHLLAVYRALPFSTSWALASAGRAMNAARTATDAIRFITRLLFASERAHIDQRTP